MGQSRKTLLYSVDRIYLVRSTGEEQNFAMLIDMIDASEAREDDENFKNAVDLLFEELEEKDPNHFAVRQYKNCLLYTSKKKQRKKNLQTRMIPQK